ncbi:transcription factor Adf-1-like [Periplaneta americana]|uniref:transcription factor Adf-1-like n=1 Tax=Periplaneta americana TaxID=6978 RepID=UPI0037E8DF57
MDCEKLISEVQKRRPLWDVKMKDYSNRSKTAKLWEEIVKEIGSTKTEAVKKWKSLRDNYRQELKKVGNFKKSGNNSSPLFKRKWIYFEQMSFLKDIISSAPMSGNPPSVPDNDMEENISEDISGNSNEILAANPEVVPEETIPTTPLSNTTSAGQFSASDARRKNLKRKREDDLFLTIEKEKLSILKTNRELQMDGDYNFLISFLPIMKQMNNTQKLNFRMKMSALALEIITGSQPASSET